MDVTIYQTDKDQKNKPNLQVILNSMIEKYKNNNYIQGRINYYIEQFLPAALENDEVAHTQREIRKQQLTEYRDEFTSCFLHKNKYYYASQTELFLKYDGIHFNIYSEDNIQHQILTTISNEKNLMPWKRKINNNIIKQIKERSPLTAIPESVTIQYVINSIYPSIFLTRNSAKYFLTIIGDCINSKTDNNLIYIISSSIKPILSEIINQCYIYFGITNCLNNIKYKYYEHEYHRCRLININPNLNINLINDSGDYNYDKSKLLNTFHGLIKNILDLLCVSSHYSLRYRSADGFLKQCSETKLVDYSLYLKNNTIESIINNFIEKSLTTCVSSKIDTKNMLFLFKKFLDSKNISNIAFYETLKLIFKSKLNYNEEEDSFMDITSTHLPIVSNFMKFWDSTISDDEHDEEIEIDELSTLFKVWLTKNKINNINVNISDGVLIELIRHFYPEVVIEYNKYLRHIKCSLWNKRLEIVNSLYLFKLKCGINEDNFTKSLYEAYEFYSSNNKHQCLSSKIYFEKTATDIISGHIDNDGLISPTWWK